MPNVPGATIIQGGTFINFLIFLSFKYFFSFGCVLKNQIICHFKGGLRLFKGLHLLFLPNVPGAMFIQGGTSIPESRVKVFLFE